MADDPWADDARPDQYDDAPAGHDPHAGDGPHADLGTYASDRDVEAENPKRALGTGVKVLVGLLIAGGLALLVCCGAGWFYVSSVSGNAERTPAGVRQRVDELLTIEVPPPVRAGRGVPHGRPADRQPVRGLQLRRGCL